MYVGQSKDAIKYAFETARKNSPCIIFIDEVDFLCGNREESDKNLKGVISEVLTQMESINDNNKGVLVVGATNMPEKLDSAVRRRFEKRIYVGLPSETEREAMFSKMLIGNRHNLSELDMKKLAKMTKGYSGADINVVVREALMMPIRSLMDSKFFKVFEKHFCIWKKKFILNLFIFSVTSRWNVVTMQRKRIWSNKENVERFSIF